MESMAAVVGEHLFWCNQQGSYCHGAQMCTTACMQVGMAALCKQLDLEAAARAASRGDLPACNEFVGGLNWCMDTANVVHGRIEAILGGGGNHFMPRSRMISVNELINVLGIKLDALGVGLQELVLCRRGVDTRLLLVEEGLRYKAESCYISLSHLPLCMEASRRNNNNVCVALVTANGHTVCAARYGALSYAIFDPMPGQMWVGISGAQMASRLQRMLGMPSSVRGHGAENVCLADKREEEEGKKKQRSKMDKKKKNQGSSVQWEDWHNEEGCDGDDGILQFGVVDSGKRAGEKDDMLFYGDVTLLHVK
jgi:hypothetical protein